MVTATARSPRRTQPHGIQVCLSTPLHLSLTAESLPSLISAQYHNLYAYDTTTLLVTSEGLMDAGNLSSERALERKWTRKNKPASVRPHRGSHACVQKKKVKLICRQIFRERPVESFAAGRCCQAGGIVGPTIYHFWIIYISSLLYHHLCAT